MDLELGPADAEFRGDVRAFLDENLSEDLKAAVTASTGTFCDLSAMSRWHAILHAKGWVAPDWPMEFGGPGWTDTRRHIFASECALAGAPPTHTFGIRMCGPVLIRFGTPEQQLHYLPRILTGEHRRCQGYSEPGSGSDLASPKTAARSDGDDYIVTCSKIWTTLAHQATHMFCLVRTDFEVRAQAGITFLLIDMSSPGISIRPIVNIAGDHEFNQVFFDEVRVPKINRVSEENAGWAVAKHLLEFERGGNYAAGLRARLAWVRRLAVDGLADDESFRGRLARAEIEVTAVEMQERRVISALSLGEAPGNAASLLKLQGSELTQRLDELAIEAVGPRMSTVDVQADVAMGRYLYDRSVTIFGGTSEIQRNIIARTVLAL